MNAAAAAKEHKPVFKMDGALRSDIVPHLQREHALQLGLKTQVIRE